MPFLPVLLELVAWPMLQAAVVPEPRAPRVRLPQPPAGSYTVLVADWGHHTAIVVQQPPGWRLGPPGAEAAPFLEVGWGDRRYFHGGERSPQTLVAALFLPTDSVLFLAGHPDPPRLAAALGPDTLLLSVMAANNEIGVLQPLAAIGALCRKHGVLF
ncbi:aminotransferase class V-fold PLP-dependent enzyme, partial [Synechococcus sp. BA-120 BA3]|nr:aminotransferase class V-fold PLP-dependent enzyme [Synechococcus sp. BA-120 BA3]